MKYSFLIKTVLFLFLITVFSSFVFALEDTDLLTYMEFDSDVTDATSNLTYTGTNEQYDTSDYMSGTASWNGTHENPRYAISDQEINLSHKENWSVSCWFQSNANQEETMLAFDASEIMSCPSDAVSYVRFIPRIGGTCAGTRNDSFVYDDGNWHLIVGVKQDDSQFLYIDGDLHGTEGPCTYSSNHTNVNIRWGTLNLAPNYRDWGGLLDECEIVKKAYSQADVTEKWNSGTGTFYPYTVAPDTTPPNITKSTYNHTTALNATYQTIWADVSVGEPSLTTDPTPTITFTLTEVGNCSIGIADLNYTEMTSAFGNPCATTDTITMSCTSNETFALSIGNQERFSTCIDAAGNTMANSTSGGLSITLVDLINPTFSNAVNDSTTNFEIYSNFTANITITDDTAIDYYIFSTNVTGTWVNDSAVDISGTEYNASVGKNISIAADNQICWYYWANDTYGNTNQSSDECFIVANTIPTHNTPVLNATDNPLNRTFANLTVYNQSTVDVDNNSIRNIIDWRLNGSSVAVLNMPFEKLDDSVFNATKDYSSNDNNGSEAGGVTWNSSGGYDGKGAFEFDGVDGNIKIPDSDSLTFVRGTVDKPFSITSWVNMNDATGFRILSKGNNSVNGREYAFTINGTGNLSLSLFGSNWNLWIMAESDMEFFSLENQWVFVGATYNGNETAKGITLYYNGVAIDSEKVTNGAYSYMRNRDSGAYIGRYFDSSLYANGTIDEIVVYNWSLTAQQMWAIYENKTDTIVSQETVRGDNWSACITPNDGTADGLTKCNNLIVQNTPPIITLNAPVNNSTVPNKNYAFLNVTLNDNDTDSMDVSFYNETTLITETLLTRVGFNQEVVDSTGNFTYTVTNESYDTTYYKEGNASWDGTHETGRFAVSDQQINLTTDENWSVSCWLQSDFAQEETVLAFSDQIMSCPDDSLTYIRFIPRMGGTCAGSRNTSIAYADGNWHLYVGVKEDDGQRLYIDGELHDNETGCGYTTNLTNQNIRWGTKNIVPAVYRDWSGNLDDCIIAKRVLTQTEITELYAGLSTSYNVPSGGSATFNWTGLTSNTTYTFYTIADDRTGTTTSDTFTFHTLVNNLPVVSLVNVSSSDSLNRTNGTLTGDYTYSDPDSDTETNNETLWYNNSNLVSSLNNFISIASGNTSKGDVWIFSVRAYDGFEWGAWVNSTGLTIENTGPVFDQDLTNQTAYSDRTFTYNINCSDVDKGDTITYYDNTTLFNIDSSTGIISEKPAESEYGNQTILITCGDGTANVSQSFIYEIIDASPPAWVNIPANATLEYMVDSLNEDFNATDGGVGIDDYFINDSTNFVINSGTGVLGNNTNLSVGIYNINVSVNDSNNNINSTDYRVTVQDTTVPTISAPDNVTLEFKTDSLEVTFNATDHSTLGSWFIDDTTNFSISSSGTLTNITELVLINYTINVSINDTYNNIGSFIYGVEIQDTITPSWSNNGTNASASTKYGETIYFNVTLSNKEGGFQIFSYYNGSDWVNDSAAAWTTPADLLETRTVTATRGMEINWSWWFNDSAGNINETDVWGITINNTIPVASSVNITSSDSLNRTNGTLTGSWTYSDIDGDTETNNETLWFNDTIEVIDLRNLISIDSANTTKGESWIFSVRTYDNYNWGNWVNSSAFTVENTDPEATLNAPADGSTNWNITVLLNVTITDLNSDDTNVSVYNNATGALLNITLNVVSGSYVTYTWTGLAKNTTYAWLVGMEDDVSDVNSTVWTFTTAIFPIVTLNSPTDGYTENSSNLVSFNCSVVDDQNLLSNSLYITNRSNQSFGFNQSANISGTSNESVFIVNLANGDYAWNCYACDNDSFCSFADSNFSLTVNINYTLTLCPYMDFIYILPNISLYNYTTQTLTQYNSSPVNESLCGFSYNFTSNAFGNLQAKINISLNSSYALRYNNVNMTNESWQTIISVSPGVDYSFNITGDYINATSESEDWGDSFRIN